MTETEEGVEIICDTSHNYRVPLPMLMTWSETKQSCHNLGHANITETLNEDKLQEFVSWFEDEHGPCRDIWTPITDEAEEGVFINTNTGKQPSYIPWMKGQPNGGTLQNSVAIRIESQGLNISKEQTKYGLAFHDIKKTDQFCGSCTLERATLFTLWGRCKRTYLGNKLIIKIQSD